MADDTIAVIDYVGWNNGRELHIVGVSLGGMISQGELLLRCTILFADGGGGQKSPSKFLSASSR
jgi:hypothetical protein